MRTFAVFFLILAVVVHADVVRAQWVPDGIVLCDVPAFQGEAVIVSDGVGGAIVVWEDRRSGSSDIYMQRVTGAGTAKWTVDGRALCAAADNQVKPMIVSDGAGGAIVTWRDERGTGMDIYAQRVNAGGAALWATNGVALCTAAGYQDSPEIVSDGAGGAIVTWNDYRSGTNLDVYAQRVGPTGVVQWMTDGVALCTQDSTQMSPTIAPDGAGGAIVTWTDDRGALFDRDIYAQRVNPVGAILWTIDGVPVCTAAGIQDYHSPVMNGIGGAIVTWGDNRNAATYYDIYAQRLDAAGVAQWTTDGVAMCTAANMQFDPQIVSDGTSGAIVVWTDTRHDYANYDLYAQRINASGAVQWTLDGVAVSTAPKDQYASAIVTDGAGGAIVTWTDFRGISPHDIYAQRIGSSGAMNWTIDGIPVCTAVSNQVFSSIASDGGGGAIVTWRDFRSGGGWDIYAQRISANGLVPTAVKTPPVTSLAFGRIHPNPFSAETVFEISVSQDSPVSIDVFDVAGRRVRTMAVGSVGAGSVRLAFDGRDQDANALPSGVYFVRVHAAAETVTRKMVIAR